MCIDMCVDMHMDMCIALDRQVVQELSQEDETQEWVLISPA